MDRRKFASLLGLAFLGRNAAASAGNAQAGGKIQKLSLPEDEWRKRLAPEQFAVLRQEATARARARSTASIARGNSCARAASSRSSPRT